MSSRKNPEKARGPLELSIAAQHFQEIMTGMRHVLLVPQLTELAAGDVVTLQVEGRPLPYLQVRLTCVERYLALERSEGERPAVERPMLALSFNLGLGWPRQPGGTS